MATGDEKRPLTCSGGPDWKAGAVVLCLISWTLYASLGWLFI
jgi:hypothetical protein